MPIHLTYHATAGRLPAAGLDAYTINYATNGNIDSKTGTGTYVYDQFYFSKPHAVDKIENPTNAISTDRQDITHIGINDKTCPSLPSAKPYARLAGGETQ